MSYFESLSKSDELEMEDTVCDGTTASCSKGKHIAKSSTLLNHFTVEKHKPDAAYHNSHSQITNSHSSSEGDPEMSQDEIDHLFTDAELDSWLDDIT